MPEIIQWFALNVRHQQERVAERFLSEQKLETLLPLFRTRRQWSDRVVQLELPVFPGYLFCRYGSGNKLQVLRTPGVLGAVAFGGSPQPVPDDEIENLRTALNSGRRLEPCSILRAGQRVRLGAGPLRGVEGILQTVNGGQRVVVGIQILNRAVSVEVSEADLIPVGVN
ncbi:MAG: UpxY family transcription antiterminator [Bryobacteraceae bacterium]|nr:UpxY family transcription antiterminator [Bryobacteraceae bacterium]